jgi:Ser/Thr protein kinase RdoA (MazF antagonist)
MHAWRNRVDRAQVESCYLPAALEALAHFPVAAEGVALVAHSENVTFQVRVGGADTDYVLRLHRPGYNTIEELQSERLWTGALQRAGIAAPVSLRSRSGQHFEPIDIPATGERRYAGMTTWLDGQPLSGYLATCSDPAERKRIFCRMGGIIAAIHNQSSGWKEPTGFTRRRLDLEGLLGEEPLWGRFWEHAKLTRVERALLLRARDKARAALLGYGMTPVNFGLIHSDLHPENIIYDGENLAVIDFDDAGFGWHMYEIASALMEDRFAPDSEALEAALLEGYREQRQLAEADIALLPTFLLVRGMAVIGWYHQRPEHAEPEFFEQVKDMVLLASGG